MYYLGDLIYVNDLRSCCMSDLEINPYHDFYLGLCACIEELYHSKYCLHAYAVLIAAVAMQTHTVSCYASATIHNGATLFYI